jgi:hypothetical protein
MLTPVNRWMYLAVWPAAAFVGWAAFVPDWMSRTTFGWLNGAVLVSALTLWSGTNSVWSCRVRRGGKL